MADNASENQIRTVVENWAQAVRAGDIDGVLAHHTDDVVMFDVPPPLQLKGVAEYRKAWEPFLSFVGKDGFDVIDLVITAGRDVAFCHSLLRIGKEAEPVVRLTLGFRKVGGEWLITHEHHSAPIDVT